MGTTCPGGGAPCPTDVNKDGITSNSDLGLVLLKIGARCNVGVFDVSNATYGSGYVDIQVYISSDNTITSLDFSFNFNETKLTFSTINTVTSYPAFSPSFYQHPVDRKLRMTSFTSTHFDNDLTLVSVRFTIGTGVTVTQSDFSNAAVYLNGNTTGYIVR